MTSWLSPMQAKWDDISGSGSKLGTTYLFEVLLCLLVHRHLLLRDVQPAGWGYAGTHENDGRERNKIRGWKARRGYLTLWVRMISLILYPDSEYWNVSLYSLVLQKLYLRYWGIGFHTWGSHSSPNLHPLAKFNISCGSAKSVRGKLHQWWIKWHAVVFSIADWEESPLHCLWKSTFKFNADLPLRRCSYPQLSLLACGRLCGVK